MAACEPFFAVLRDDRGELHFVVAVHDFRRGERLLGIHTHVERRVESVRETSLRTIELCTAHTEIHQDAHRLFSFTVPLDQSAELLESSVHDLRPVAEASESVVQGMMGFKGRR
jgi:hypothetical protein